MYYICIYIESVALNFHLMVSRRKKKVVTSVIVHLNVSANAYLYTHNEYTCAQEYIRKSM